MAVYKALLDLITERKKEIESLEDHCVSDEAKFEIIKEFAERLKEKILTYSEQVNDYGITVLTQLYDMIDNLVKEMTEGEYND